MNLERVNVLGVGISVINLATAGAAIAGALEQRRKGYICITGVHGVMEAQSNPDFRRILNEAFLCTPDGMPMVWLGKWHGFKQMGLVYGPDLMLEVCDWSRRTGRTHFFFGGEPGVAEQLKVKLEARFPGLQVVGTYTPPFRPLNPAEEEALVRVVAATRPDIIWVGLSTPKQEKFMAQYLGRLDTTLLVGVGAAFDLHAGRTAPVPRWMHHVGLAWMFRLCQEPRRLGRRYLKNNPLFAGKIFCQLAGLKKYFLE